MPFGIIVKRYDHYNRAMNIHIRSKRHYDYEMKKRGLVSSEEGQRLADKHNKEKKWKPSGECINIIKAMKDASDKNGNVVLGHHPKIVKAMEKKGMSFDLSKLPQHYHPKGGFEDAV